MAINFESQVCGGLPVHVEASIAPAEPDVGIMYSHTDEIELFWPGGKHHLPDKVINRVSEKDWHRLEEEALEANSQEPDMW